jgi:transcriptional regulator NrdR family protein
MEVGGKMAFQLDDRTCWVCNQRFDTVEEHNQHYRKCADTNIVTEFSDEEIFDAIHNEKHY